MLIVLFDGVQSLDVSGPLEVLTGANKCMDGAPAYTVRTAAVGGAAVRSSSGLRITPDLDLGDAAVPDLLLVPGGEGARCVDPGVVAWLRRHAREAERVVSVCTGAFLLAEAGLLAGRRVTTHWSHCDALARAYPDLDVDPEPIFVRDGDVLTSAGVTAGVDVTLAVVEDDVGHETALAVARELVVFLRRPGNQAQFSAPLAAQVADRDPLRELQHWIVEHPEADLSVEALARRASLSARQFARAFSAEVGVSPGRYVDRVRLEAARRRLEDSDDSIAAVVRACGFGTAEAMRRAFLRTLDVAPAEYRRRFRTRAAPARVV